MTRAAVRRGSWGALDLFAKPVGVATGKHGRNPNYTTGQQLTWAIEEAHRSFTFMATQFHLSLSISTFFVAFAVTVTSWVSMGLGFHTDPCEDQPSCTPLDSIFNRLQKLSFSRDNTNAPGVVMSILAHTIIHKLTHSRLKLNTASRWPPSCCSDTSDLQRQGPPCWIRLLNIFCDVSHLCVTMPLRGVLTAVGQSNIHFSAGMQRFPVEECFVKNWSMLSLYPPVIHFKIVTATVKWSVITKFEKKKKSTWSFL